MSHEPASKGRKTAWTVVSTVILALGLFGCSGGGGGGNVVGITPQPPGGDHPDTRANAAVVRPGQEIEATLASADDVDFFRIDLAERQEIKFTLDAEAGIEIAVLDSDGAVIATAVTESKVETTISAAGRIFIRVRDKTKRGWDRLNRTRGVKAYSFISDVVALTRTIINVKRGIPHYMLTVGGVGVDFDLRDHFTLPDGRRVVSSVTAQLPGVSASIQGTTVRLSASGATVPGGVRLVLKLCVPIVNYCFHEAFAATVIPPRAAGLRVKPEFRTSGGSFTLAAGERKQITFLRNYFELELEPAQEGSPAWTRERNSWRYSAAFVPPNPRGWTAAITGTSPNQLLRVVAPASSDTQAPDEVVVAVTVTKTVTARERQTATVRFAFEVEEEDETPPGAFEPLVYTGANCRTAANPQLRGMFHSGGIRVDVATLSSVVRYDLNSASCDSTLTALYASILEAAQRCDGGGAISGRREAFIRSVETLFGVAYDRQLSDGPLCYSRWRPDVHPSTGGWRIPELVRAWQQGRE